MIRWSRALCGLLVFCSLSAQVSVPGKHVLDGLDFSAAPEAGWFADPATGRLGMQLPFQAVPGEVPIPVVLRFEASGVLDENLLSRPINGPRQPPIVVRRTSRTPPTAWLDFGNELRLEDGSPVRDLAPGTGDNLAAPPLFGLAPRAWSQVSVTPDRKLISYDATLADLGAWAGRAAALAPVGFEAVEGYRVVMDRDRARVLVQLPGTGHFAPLLWLDRFGHAVTFQWKRSQTPEGIPVVSVQALNSRGQGVQAQWLLGDASVEQPLCRVDYLGLQAPSLQVTGRGAGSQAFMPTRLEAGDPAQLAQPAWAQAPPPAPRGNPWALTQIWTFLYAGDPPDLATVIEPQGLTTTFEYESQAFFRGNAVTSPTGADIRHFRALRSALARDPLTGLTLSHAWTRTVPVFEPTGGVWNRTPWETTHRQAYSDGDPAAVPLERLTFAGGLLGAPDEAGALRSEVLSTDGRVWSDTQYGWGSTPSGKPTRIRIHTVEGEPVRTRSLILDPVTGVVLSETLQDGARVTATTYDTDGNRLNPGRSLRVQVTAKAGDRLEAQGPDQVRAYDERGLLVEEALEAAPGQLRGRKFSYDTEGHRLSESTFATGAPDGAGRVTSYVYGADGRPATTSTSFTAPSGPVAPLVDTYRYSPEGWVLEHLDEKGVTTSYTYDSRGRVLTATSAGGPALTYAYPTERTTTWSSSAGASGSESRDGFGRPFQRVRGEGVTETYGYDVLGRRTRLQETVPGGGTRTSAWTFDPLSRVVTSALAGATTEVRISHAEAGGLALTTTTQGDLAQTLGLDVLGQQVLVQDPAAETRTQFDGLGRPTRITTGPPGGGGPQVRAFTYTAFGDLASRTDPETGTTTFEAHNALGAPTRIREAGGRTTVVAYDGLGRVTSRTNPDTEDSLEFTYAGPHRASASSRSGNRVSSVALEYDALGRCVGETLRPNADSTWTIGYGYDAFGRRDQVVYPDGRIVRYAFDPKTGQPGTATLGQGGQLVHLDFNPWGNRAGAVFGSGAREAWGYDSTGTRMTRWTVAPVGAGTPPTDRAYAYDALDHLQAAGEWTSLAHDPLGRLTAAEGPGRAFAYGHDAFHNLIRARASGAVPTGSVDFALDPLADNRLPSLANGVPGWDLNAAGEATSLGTGLAADPVLRLAWDGLGRLASTTRAEGVQTFGYFPTGLRSLQLEAGHPERSRAYVYTQEGLLLGEYSGEGGSLTWLRDVIHLGGQAVAEIDGAGIHELHCDPQGTPRLITDGGTGAQAGLQAFGPFGEPLGLDEGYRPLTGYTGHIQTDPSGLIYMRGRFYSPAWRRFLSSDRGADPNQLNAYAYALGSPLMATDPSGMASDYAFKSYANWLADLGHDLFGSGNNPGGNAGAMEAFLRYFGRGMPSATVEVLGRFAPVDSYIGAVALANAGLGGNGAWGKSGGHAANGMSQSTKSRASFWNVVSNNQRQVSVKRLLPKWFCGPVSNMTGAVGLGNSMSKFGKLPLLEIASGGSVLAGAAGIGTVLSAGATVYEAGTWVGSLWVGVLYELFPAHVEEMGNVNP